MPCGFKLLRKLGVYYTAKIHILHKNILLKTDDFIPITAQKLA